MFTLRVNIIEVLRRPDTNNVIITVELEDHSLITREIDLGSFETWEKFAEWLLSQEVDFIHDHSLSKRLKIDYYIDEVTGERIVDNVHSSPVTPFPN